MVNWLSENIVIMALKGAVIRTVKQASISALVEEGHRVKETAKIRNSSCTQI